MRICLSAVKIPNTYSNLSIWTNQKKKKEKNESVGKVQGDCIVQFLKLRFKGVTTVRSLITEESLNKQETAILAIKYGKS